MDAIILTVIIDNVMSLNAYNNCTSFYSEYSGNDEADQYNFAYDYNEDGYPRQAIVTYHDFNSVVTIQLLLIF